MSNIIDFLMKNFYFVIIILFFLSRLFSKPSSQNKPTQMPDFGGGGKASQPIPQTSRMERREPDWSDKQEEPRPRLDIERREVQTRHEPAANVLYASQAFVADEPPARRLAADRAASALVSSHSQSVSTSKKAAVTAGDLRKAVIWSEVLGPPRAKRPFRK